MHIYCIGIGGIGLSAVAQFCHQQGHSVSGSDQQESAITHLLQSKGIRVYTPQHKKNIPDECDVVIYSEAIDTQHAERVEAQRRSIPLYSYFEFLGHISQKYTTIAVAGTHGKTTTCGLIAGGAMAASFDATFFVGSTLPLFENSNFHSGSNEFIVLEACEYRNNFRFLTPDITLITNIEWDHPDAYKTEKEYFNAFRSFLLQSNTVIYHSDDHVTKDLLRDIPTQKIEVDFQASQVDTLTLFGDHNKRNAHLALALGNILPLDIQSFRKGVLHFSGTGRRQEHIGSYNGILVYDDYGHHPTEIKATIDAFRSKFPGSRIGLLYEPHQFSRTHTFQKEFETVLSTPDVVGIYPIYEARDSAEDKSKISSAILAESITNAHLVTTHDDVRNLCAHLQENDILLFMGAGNISRFAREWMQSVS